MLTQEFWDEVWSHNIVILRDFVGGIWPLDPTLYKKHTIDDLYGAFPINILKQTRRTHGFASHPNSKVASTVRTYIDYMKKVQERAGKKARGKPAATVEFAVNLNIGTWSEYIDDLRENLPKCLLF